MRPGSGIISDGVDEACNVSDATMCEVLTVEVRFLVVLTSPEGPGSRRRFCKWRVKGGEGRVKGSRFRIER